MKPKLLQVGFNAYEFMKTHGHMPREVALWIFYFRDDPTEPWIPGQKENKMRPLVYFEAKALATAEARRRGVSGVRLDPMPL